MEIKKLEAAIEAILFTMGNSVELKKIASALELPEQQTREIMEGLIQKYQDSSSGMQIVELEDSFQMCGKTEWDR